VSKVPQYDYACTDQNCTNVQEEDAKMSEFRDLHPVCIICGSPCNYQFTPTVVQFALKDGPSGSWPSKGNRFKQYRADQSEKMKRRQRDRYGHLNRDAVPNYQGQLTEDWRDAQDLAMKDKERNPDSLATAATFNDSIKKEKRKKNGPISG
jgi:hypothetical protein